MMTQEQINDLFSQIGKKNADHVNELFSAARKEDSEKLTVMEAKLLNDLGPDSEHMKAIQSQLDKIQTDLKVSANKEQRMKTFREHLSEMTKTEGFQQLRKNRGYTHEIPIDFSERKSAGPILNSGLGGALPAPTWLPGVVRTPDQPPFISELCPVVPTESDTVYYVYRSGRTDGAAAQTEGQALGQSDLTYTQTSATVADYGSFIKISDNALSDNSFISGQISSELPWLVMNEVDSAILTAAIAGATAFSVSGKTYDSSVPSANNYDVLRAAVNQARAAHYQPDAILVHYDDFASMEMSKSVDGIYTLPPFYQNMVISGVRVIPNATVTTGDFLVGTFARTPLAMRQNLVIEFGYDDDDFSKRMVTVRAYIRAAYVMSTQYSGGFIKGDFTDGIAAMLKA